MGLGSFWEETPELAPLPLCLSHQDIVRRQPSASQKTPRETLLAGP